MKRRDSFDTWLLLNEDYLAKKFHQSWLNIYRLSLKIREEKERVNGKG